MRRTLSLMVAGVIAIGVSGCDDFLAPEPATFASSETYFKTPDQMEQAVSGLYAEMRGLFGGNLRLLNDLRAGGQTNARADRPRGLAGRRFAAELRRALGDKPLATYEVVYGHAWKGSDVKTVRVFKSVP